MAAIGSAFCGPYAAAALCYATAQYDIARAHGASPSEAARGAAVAGVTYYLGQQASSWVGSTFDINAGAGQYALNVAANGVVGGTLTVAQGGKFGYGFVSSAFAAGAKSLNFDIWGKSANYKIHRTVTAAVIGGTASKLGGGKFANGAASAAFTHLFNAEWSAKRNPAKQIADKALEDEHLSWGEANKIWRNNDAPNFEVTVDASQLTVEQTSDFNENGIATGKVQGSDWLVHGSVTLSRDAQGNITLPPGPYDFQPHGSFLSRPVRNFETYGGFYMASNAGISVGTDFLIKYSGHPNVIK